MERWVPDAVGEEEVWWVDRGEFWQEGGRNRDGDVTGGRHATFIVHISVDSRTQFTRQT